MITRFTDATAEEINKVMDRSWQAFHVYRKFPLKKRADFHERHCQRKWRRLQMNW